MVLRNATHDDIPAIMDMARTFVSEASYGYTFDEERTEGLVRAYLEDPYHAVFLSEIDGKLAGAWIGAIIREWTNEPMCYVNKFYVMPWARGKGVSRPLMASLVKWADDNGAMDTFATATANVGANDLFAKLCEEQGFVRFGPTLVRRKA